MGEAVFLVVPGVATRWRACLGHRLSLTCQMTRSLLQMPAEQLQQKDQQILLLLEEKEMIFRDMTECSTPLPEDCSPTHSCRTLFRSNTEEALKGGPLMKSAINEGNLHSASPPHHSGLHASNYLPVRTFFRCKMKHKIQRTTQNVFCFSKLLSSEHPYNYFPGQEIKCGQIPKKAFPHLLSPSQLSPSLPQGTGIMTFRVMT